MYLPYDLPGAVARFLDHFKPALALIVETELWPNLLFGCRDRDIPTHILNARLSARSLRGYRVLSPLIRRALRTVRLVAAQSRDDARRFVMLGALPERVQVTGNLKFDMLPVDTEAFASEFAAHRGTAGAVWIAASTHEDEEAAVLDAHRLLRRSHPDALLLWAPRHPERFRAAAERAQAAGFVVGHAQRGCAGHGGDRGCSWSTPWANWCASTPAPGSPSSVAACSRSAGTTCWNRRRPAPRSSAARTCTTSPTSRERLREAEAMRVVDDAPATRRGLAGPVRGRGCARTHGDERAHLLEEGRGALERTRC